MGMYKKKKKTSQSPANISTNSEQKGNKLTRVSKSQLYSTIVFEKVTRVVGAKEKERQKKYKTLCKKAGGLLRTVGLIQFLTYLAAKATKESEIHHQFLLDDLCAELKQVGVTKASDSSQLLDEIRKQNLPEYMHTTTQALGFLQWHKRIADILITGEE